MLLRVKFILSPIALLNLIFFTMEWLASKLQRRNKDELQTYSIFSIAGSQIFGYSDGDINQGNSIGELHF
jgi:hypothetical protein